MTETIKYLISDHQAMLTLLKRSKSDKLSTEQRSAYLAAVKSLLENHLKYEDKNLYPRMRELSKGNNAAIDTISEFTTGLEKLGSIVFNFFQQNENAPDNIHNSSDFTKIIKLLEVRIQKEESKLYPLYEKLTKQ